MTRKNDNTDELRRTTMQTLHGKMCARLYEEFGDRALDVIREVYGSYGFEIGAGLQRKWRPENLKDAASIFFMLCEKAGLPYHYELKEETLLWDGYKCPFGLEDTSRPVCEAMMRMDVEMLRALMGLEKGQVELTIEKTLAAGDEYCRGSLRVKK